MLRQSLSQPGKVKAVNGMGADPGEHASLGKRRAQLAAEGSPWKSTMALLLLFAVLGLQLRQLSLQASSQQVLQDAVASLALGGQQPQAQREAAAPSVPCPVADAARAWVPQVFNRCEVAIVGGRKRDGYGSWPLCVNHVPRDAVVYSFGIGLDASFDAAMMERGATVYGFDPTIKPESIPGLFGPRSADFSARFKFMQVGLGASNGVATFLKAKRPGIQSMTALGVGETGQQYESVGFQAAVLTLPALMAIHGHTHVDLLKVDVEGIEFGVCERRAEFLDALARVGQVVYEFHERLIRAPAGKKARCIALLRERGLTLVNRTETEEYVFARVAPGAAVVNLPRH